MEKHRGKYAGTGVADRPPRHGKAVARRPVRPVQRNRRRRSNASVPLEAVLDMAEHLDPPAGQVAEQTRTGARYRLRAVVCHEGNSVHSGHYTCSVHDRVPAAAPGASAAEGGRRRGAWTLYDDRVVDPPKEELPPELPSELHQSGRHLAVSFCT